MKYIIAIIKPHKLDDVMKALEEVDVNLMTVSNVLGRGRQMGVTEVYRGAKEVGSLLKKVKLEIAVNEEFVEPTVQAITKGARTGEIGDGKIFVLDLPDVIRIRTGERGGRRSDETANGHRVSGREGPPFPTPGARGEIYFPARASRSVLTCVPRLFQRMSSRKMPW